MLKIIKEIWDFADTQHRRFLTGIMANFFRGIFSLFDYFAIYLAITVLLTRSALFKAMIPCVALIAAGVLGRIVMDGISSSQLMEAGYGVSKEKRLHAADKLRYVPMGYLEAMNLSEITGGLTTTLQDVETLAPMVLVQLISGMIGTFLMAITVTVLNLQVGIAAIFAIILYFFITSFQMRSLEGITKLRQEASDCLIFQVLEYLQGIQVIKGFGLFGEKNRSLTAAVWKSCKENTDLNVKAIPWDKGLRLLLSLFSVAVCAVALIQYLQGGMTLPLCLFLLVMSFVLFSSLDFAGSSISLLNLIDAAISQVKKLDSLPVMENGAINKKPESHEILCENVGFAYGNKEVIEDFTAVLKEKEITAVVGPSGSGKTTFAYLLSRFWDIHGGSIKIGGVDIRNYDYDTLLSQFSYVFQNVYLFHDTIENNIGFGRLCATHEEIVEAAQKARCHDFIMKLPEGYHTVIGEGGSSLSGGEKQRISIARAILKDAPIIVLDEATASVDPENELEIMEAIMELSKNKTCLIIAHRLNTVRNAGQILVIDKGKIVQRGRHDELMKKAGLYRRFITLKEQAGQWKL